MTSVFTPTFSPELVENVERMLQRRGINSTEHEDPAGLPATVVLKIVGTIALPNTTSPTLFSNEDKKIIAYFIVDTKVTIEIMRLILENNTTCRHIILLHEKALTPDVRQAIVVNTIYYIETFTFADISYDPILVAPRHFVVSVSDEINEATNSVNKCTVFKEYRKLPVILASDVISRYYGFRKGQIIGLENDNGTIMYRLCV